MILRDRFLSHSGSLVLAAFLFALGLGVGIGIAPVTAARNADAAAGVSSESAGSVRLAHRAEVLRVIDGDTFEARVHLWPGLSITTRVRLRGIDTPEMRGRCMDERVRAEQARDALRGILDQGEVAIARVTLDKYGGRVLADASTFATADVAAAMLEIGHARRYEARRASWCP
jgi:endonuclease YncB( thermonuclease family)